MCVRGLSSASSDCVRIRHEVGPGHHSRDGEEVEEHPLRHLVPGRVQVAEFGHLCDLRRGQDRGPLGAGADRRGAAASSPAYRILLLSLSLPLSLSLSLKSRVSHSSHTVSSLYPLFSRERTLARSLGSGESRGERWGQLPSSLAADSRVVLAVFGRGVSDSRSKNYHLCLSVSLSLDRFHQPDMAKMAAAPAAAPAAAAADEAEARRRSLSCLFARSTRVARSKLVARTLSREILPLDSNVGRATTSRSTRPVWSRRTLSSSCRKPRAVALRPSARSSPTTATSSTPSWSSPCKV